jgi:hypothetical protein
MGGSESRAERHSAAALREDAARQSRNQDEFGKQELRKRFPEFANPESSQEETILGYSTAKKSQ